MFPALPGDDRVATDPAFTAAEPGRVAPLVSILIPAYEREAMLAEAVRSALAQDYANLEVVVVDDASPNARHVDVRAVVDARLRFHRNCANLGRVANYRHALCDLARGDWVVMLDGDDRFDDPRFISVAMAAAAAAPDVCIVAAQCTTASSRGTQVSANPGGAVVAGLDVLKLLPGDPYLFHHLATVYRRADAVALDFYRADVLSSDWESLYRLAAGGRVAFIECIAGTWRLHGDNASAASDWQTLARNLTVWPAIYAHATRTGMAADDAAAACRRCLARFGAIHMASVLAGRRPLDVSHVVRALWQLDARACGVALLALARRLVQAALRRVRKPSGPALA